MHGIFPTHNKYYIASEIFPHLSKEEIKEVYFPPTTRKKALDQKDQPRSKKQWNEDAE